ncbi:Olfactory Receptor 2W3 [Manis pentadactyla]|nr:Olfactory Receptor 2W3 [Manis pentadactyla]
MDGAHERAQGGFILLGFCGHPHLERILFVVILIAYLLTFMGNTTTVLVSRLDPQIHTPMYFFFSHLSFLGLSFTSSSNPQPALQPECTRQDHQLPGLRPSALPLPSLGGEECLLLAVMAHDRSAAVCKPPHYTEIMNPRLSPGLVSVACGCGIASSLAMSPATLAHPTAAATVWTASSAWSCHLSIKPSLLSFPVAKQSLGAAAFEVTLHRQPGGLHSVPLQRWGIHGAEPLRPREAHTRGGPSPKAACPGPGGPGGEYPADPSHPAGRQAPPSDVLSAQPPPLVDVMTVSTTVPRMAADFLTKSQAITFIGCSTQAFVFLALSGTEALLLGFMSHDRYVAICHPLRYCVLMSKNICRFTVTCKWASSSVTALIQLLYIFQFPFCGSWLINHFFCEVPSLLPLVCQDNSQYENVVLLMVLIILLVPFVAI